MASGHKDEPFSASASERCIQDRFADIVRLHPDRLAVSDASQTLTYRELATLAATISANILEAVSDRSGPIVLIVGNDAWLPAASLGILMAGRCYVPLDISHPLERNLAIAERSGAAAILTAGDAAEIVRGMLTIDLPVIDLEALRAERTASISGSPDDLAWIIYTSGSTGAPKGVYQNHRGLLHDALGFGNVHCVTPDDRLALTAPPNLIAATRPMMGMLMQGASIHMTPPGDGGAEGVKGTIHDRSITILRCVPRLFRRVAEAYGDKSEESVRLVSLGGDRGEWSDFDLCRRAFPSAEFHVHLGSTESSTLNFEWNVDPKYRTTSTRLPVGYPCGDREVALLDPEGRPVADGEIGEFTVKSRYVALGYWRDPELTAQAFSTDPDAPYLRTLRTGDLGRKRPDGLYEFHGRRDEQIKIDGFRVELGEIEAAGLGLRGVRDCAVLARCDNDGVPNAVAAYFELAESASGLLPRHIKAQLAELLPKYMLPAMVFVVDSLPRLKNHKLDRRKLAEIDAEKRKAHDTHDPLVAAVAEVFRIVLPTASPTADDTAASLGCDSLQAITLAIELEERFALGLAPDAFNMEESVLSLAKRIARKKKMSSAVVNA